VWKLYARAIERAGHTATLLEWDDSIPADPFIFLFVGLLILVFGPGKFAVDTLLNRVIRKRNPGTENRLVS
jgi:hypothetical protein